MNGKVARKLRKLTQKLIKESKTTLNPITVYHRVKKIYSATPKNERV